MLFGRQPCVCRVFVPKSVPLEGVDEVHAGLPGILVVQGVTRVACIGAPDVLVEPQMDIAQFQHALQVFVDLVGGVQVDFNACIRRGQIGAVAVEVRVVAVYAPSAGAASP